MLNKALIGLPTLDLIPLRLIHSSEDQMVVKVLQGEALTLDDRADLNDPPP
jgi:hypothetical protein